MIVEHDFFGKMVPYLVYLGQGEEFKLTTELSRKSAISLQLGNKKRLKSGNPVYLNKRSFIFKIKFRVSSNKDLILYEGDSSF